MLGLDLRTAKVVWTTFVLGLALFLLYTARSTVLVVIFAVLFSYLIYPLIALLERMLPRRIPRTVSIGLGFAIAIAVVAVAVSALGPRVADEATRLGQKIPELVKDPNAASRFPLPHVLEPLRARIIGFAQDQMQEGSGKALPLAKSIGASVVHAASNLIYIVLIPVLSFLLIKEGPAIRAGALARMGTRTRALWSGISEDLGFSLSRYVRALLLLSLSTLVAYGAAFTVMGVPYALLLAALAALLEFIPFIGPLAALVITVLVAGFAGFEHVPLLFGLIILYRFFQDYVLNPYLMSEGVEVPPLLVIIGLLVGEQIGGVAGIFLSVPVIAAIKIILVRASAARQQQQPVAVQQAAAIREPLQ
jgi:predicted PurR-regulated permease PerM